MFLKLYALIPNSKDWQVQNIEYILDTYKGYPACHFDKRQSPAGRTKPWTLIY